MTPTEAVARLRQLLAVGALDLPIPAGGHTSDRFAGLAKLAAGEDLSEARLAEAHSDAVAIAGEAGRTLPAGALAGVWASRFGGSMLVASERAGCWHLTGGLAFCSGAADLDLALVDARLPDGAQQLFAVPLGEGVAVDTAGWRALIPAELRPRLLEGVRPRPPRQIRRRVRRRGPTCAATTPLTGRRDGRRLRESGGRTPRSERVPVGSRPRGLIRQEHFLLGAVTTAAERVRSRHGSE